MTGPTALVVIAPFAGVFAYAAFHEVRRYRRDGAREDWREVFEFDETAPGFVAPEDLDGAEAEPDETGRDETPNASATDAETDRKHRT